MDWQRYLIDADGFVLEAPEDLLAHVDEPDYIELTHGDCFPDQIIVVRDSALPKPQYAGSEILRAPAGYQTEDQIAFDVSDSSGVSPAHALLLWRAAKGIVDEFATGEEEMVSRG